MEIGTTGVSLLEVILDREKTACEVRGLKTEAIWSGTFPIGARSKRKNCTKYCVLGRRSLCWSNTVHL